MLLPAALASAAAGPGGVSKPPQRRSGRSAASAPSQDGGLPPLLVQAGTAEILLSDSERLAKAAAEAGVNVTLLLGQGLPHVYRSMLGTPEAAGATRQIGKFLRARMR